MLEELRAVAVPLELALGFVEGVWEGGGIVGEDFEVWEEGDDGDEEGEGGEGGEGDDADDTTDSPASHSDPDTNTDDEAGRGDSDTTLTLETIPETNEDGDEAEPKTAYAILPVPVIPPADPAATLSTLPSTLFLPTLPTLSTQHPDWDAPWIRTETHSMRSECPHDGDETFAQSLAHTHILIGDAADALDFAPTGLPSSIPLDTSTPSTSTANRSSSATPSTPPNARFSRTQRGEIQCPACHFRFSPPTVTPPSLLSIKSIPSVGSVWSLYEAAPEITRVGRSMFFETPERHIKVQPQPQQLQPQLEINRKRKVSFVEPDSQAVARAKPRARLARIKTFARRLLGRK
jgi:hypothetical protein